MRIKVLESFLHAKQLYEKSDERTIDPAAGQAFCEAGMAEDLSGDVDTGTLNPHKKVLITPDNSVLGVDG